MAYFGTASCNLANSVLPELLCNNCSVPGCLEFQQSKRLILGKQPCERVYDVPASCIRFRSAAICEGVQRDQSLQLPICAPSRKRSGENTQTCTTWPLQLTWVTLRSELPSGNAHSGGARPDQVSDTTRAHFFIESVGNRAACSAIVIVAALSPEVDAAGGSARPFATFAPPRARAPGIGSYGRFDKVPCLGRRRCRPPR